MGGDHLSLRGILFDLDGTLLDSERVDIMCMTRLFHHDLGLKLSQDEIAGYRSLPSRQVLEQFAPDRVEELLTTWTAYQAQVLGQTQLFSGILETLQSLSGAGLVLGVVTGQNRAELEKTRRHIGLDGLIDVWVSADDAAFAKPHPAPVRLALDALGCPPHQAIMVGDSRFDMAAGREAGTQLGAAAWGVRDLAPLLEYHPDYIFQQPQQMMTLLQGNDHKGDAP